MGRNPKIAGLMPADPVQKHQTVILGKQMGGMGQEDGHDLGTTTNWDKALAEDKNLAGARIMVQQAE